MAAIEAEGLRRTYKQTSGFLRRRTKTIEAVRGIDFDVREGELFGLLGPNGAGKTTTIKMLVTLLIPTSGTARVLGYDVVADAQAVRRNIGYVFGGDRGAYERLSALDNLRYFSELYGVPPKVQKRRIPELLQLVGPRRPERAPGCTTRRWWCSTSRRSVSTRSALASYGRRSPTSRARARPCS